ncbi:TFP11-domain-containing protein [Pleurotus eryngii]|uniref:TFP11-domain-containing protein n=1 Tax=Pleurotus eryngii TaxID=5323 RepID=A0A9P6A5H5_PLEER|nr:TFP11-domain-containing protein [Pleurotus eryngii]
MARRKRVLDGDDSDSSENSDVGEPYFEGNADAREERELFQNPYQHQRKRKRNGKEDAIYGVFADDSDDDYKMKDKKAAARSDWTKAPAFVSGDKVELDKETETAMDIDGDSDEDDDEGEAEDEAIEEPLDAADSASDNSSSSPPPPRTREPDDDPEPPSKGIGIGFNRQANAGNGLGFKPAQPAGGGIGFTSSTSTTAGIGSSRRGLGPSTEALPSTFGKSATRTFTLSSSSPSTPKAPLDAKEALHFSKLQGSFGARMLEKMGWQAGTGLGANGEGIATPIETKLRPQKMGIAFRGFKEKTEQSKVEARRRGEAVSSDEEGGSKAKQKTKAAKKVKEEIWKKPKKAKVKVDHKTYEQIIAEAGQDAVSASASLGQIIDATGAVPREVSSLADVSLNNWAPTSEATRIPEVRHNIRLIAEACKSDLDGLAREARFLNERKQLAIREDARLRKRIEDEAQLIARLQQVQIVANEISAKSKELASVYEASLDSFSPLFYKLTIEFPVELDKYRLDEIAVAAIAPTVRRTVSQWNPLEEPSAFVSTFRTWKSVLRVRSGDEDKDTSQAVQAYANQAFTQQKSPEPAASMTPFESLLWNVWLPRVRSVLNNEWVPENPNPAIRLYEAWSSILPRYIRDNILDQLILPKVRRAVEMWKPKTGQEGDSYVSLKSLIFPWLPHLGLRLEDLLGDARRKVKGLLRSWAVGDPLPDDLDTWREVFDSGDWDTMMLKYIVPKLGATLRDDLRINPRNQVMDPITNVLLWQSALHSAVLGQLFETEFFPKWLDILYIWLTQPKVSFEEVAQWYSFWKDAFPEAVRSMPVMERGFTRGLQLMNTAIELGPDAPARLPRPDYRAEVLSMLEKKDSRAGTPKVRPPTARTREITFREIVEEYASKHDLVVMPSGKTHEMSRMPLLRVSSAGKSGRGGLLIYVLDDAVWASAEPGVGGETEEYRAISLDDMVLRANGNEP